MHWYRRFVPVEGICLRLATSQLEFPIVVGVKVVGIEGDGVFKEADGQTGEGFGAHAIATPADPLQLTLLKYKRGAGEVGVLIPPIQIL
jgi:hypothetical protein